MSDRIRRVPVWLFGIMVLGALAFGSQKAFATAVFESCPSPPWNGGSCPGGQSECVTNCDNIYGIGGYDHASCPAGCCRCFI